MSKIYICEYCGEQFENRMDARWHEIQHEHQEPRFLVQKQYLKDLRRNGVNPCDKCVRDVFETCTCAHKCKDYSLFVMEI